jgi:anti-sigma factor RsiW
MVEDEAMTHKPYHESMQGLLDGDLALADRRALEDHLATCASCQAEMAALSRVHRLFKAAPLAAPRGGFNGRFQARLAQRRARPRALWGALALGFGAVAASAVVVPVGLGAVFSTVRVAQQPATSLALLASVSAVAVFLSTLVDALFIAASALAGVLLPNPLSWAVALLALALTGVWIYVMRRIAPEMRLR